MKVNVKLFFELSWFEQCLKVVSILFKFVFQQIILNDDNDEFSIFVLQIGVIEIYCCLDELLIGIVIVFFILGLIVGMFDYSKEYWVVVKNLCIGFYLFVLIFFQFIQ